VAVLAGIAGSLVVIDLVVDLDRDATSVGRASHRENRQSSPPTTARRV